MSLTKFAIVSFLSLSCSASALSAASSVKLLPHRAIYDVKMINSDERSGVDAMTGKMVYEFTGSTCKGYTTEFRFVTTIEGNGASQVSDQRTRTFEDPDSQTLVFSTQTYTDEKLDSDVEGVAEQKDGKVIVGIDKPEGKDVTLGQAIFPVKHIVDVIDHARRGEKLYEARVFDASDEADEVNIATTLIGKPITPSKDDSEVNVIGPSAKSPVRMITTTYHKTPMQNDSLPEYQMTMALHENGITRDLTMRYSGFSLKGTLVGFEALPQASCN